MPVSVIGSAAYAVTPLNAELPSRIVSYAETEKGMTPARPSGLELLRNTRRPESCSGSGRSSSALTTLKIAVFAPMPRPSVRTATTVKPGLLRIRRRPYRTLVNIRVAYAEDGGLSRAVEDRGLGE